MLAQKVTPTLISLWLSLSSLVEASKALYILENTEATLYYDNTPGDRCAGRGQSSFTGGNGVPNCEQNGPSLAALDTGRVVAMNRTLVQLDRNAWCGKEVKIYQNDREVAFDETLVLWDVCEACASNHIIDMSVDAYLKLMDQGSCMANHGNNPVGLRVEVTDNQIWEPSPGSETYSPLPATKLYSGGGRNNNFPTGSVVPPWGENGMTIKAGEGVVTAATATTSIGVAPPSEPTATIMATSASGVQTPAPAPASPDTAAGRPPAVNVATGCGPGGCPTKGQYNCQDNKLYICNYLSNSASGLGWQLLDECPGGCDATTQTKCRQVKRRTM
ncbi:hypothetical protein IAR55_001978 [Kwoniella newhampshirensis]|uniref:Uncharacterized protein n=1 Tax=Kwoniella newhampshirensis TaxID=1651941 RepID=A0AAW0Z3K3_9TREE